MAHIVLDCPHCDALQMTMRVHAKVVTRNRELGIAYAQCGQCTFPVVALVRKGKNFKFADMNAWISHGEDVLQDAGAILEEVIPESKPSVAPEHTPEDAARVFVQAERARKRQERDTAGMAYRKTLDIALKAYDKNLKGDLRSRIDSLASNHVITETMKDWAHLVRLTGNEAAHDEVEPTEQDIEAIAMFTESLLKYLFTMPQEVEARKAAAVT